MYLSRVDSNMLTLGDACLPVTFENARKGIVDQPVSLCCMPQPTMTSELVPDLLNKDLSNFA